MASNRLEIILSGNVRDFNQKMATVDKQVDETMGNMKIKAQEAALVLGALAVTGGALVKSFVSEAVQMQKYEQTLKAITGSTKEAQAQLEAMTKFAATTPFDLKGVVDGSVKMRALGVDVERFLPLAGDLAAVFDRDLPSASLAFAKALTGSQDGLTQLQDSFGVTKKELIAAGAEMASTGSIAVGSAAQIEKLQLALESVVKSKFGGTMQAQAQTAAGAFANLDDAISRLKAALGSELADDFAAVAKSLTAVIDKFNELPSSTKGIIADAVLVVAGLAAAGSAALGLAAIFGPLIATMALYSGAATTAAGASTAAAGGMTALGTASKVAMGALGPAVLVVAALGVAFGAYIHHMGEVNQAAAQLLQTQEQVAHNFREEKQLVLDAADALRIYAGDAKRAGTALAEVFREAGKTEKDVSQALSGLVDQLNKAQENGDDVLVKRIQDRILALRHAKEQLSGTEAEKVSKEQAASDAAKASIAAQAKAVDDYQKRSSAGYYESSKTQLNALDQVLAGLDKNHADYEKLYLSRTKLARDVAEDSRKATLDEALYEVDQLKVYGDKRLKDQELVLKRILTEESLSSDERKKIELDLLKTRQDINVKAVDDAKQAAAAKLKIEKDNIKALKDAAALKQRVLDSEAKLADVQLSSLEDQASKGKDVTDQIVEQLKAKEKLNVESLKQKASIEKIGKTSAQQASLQKIYDAEIKASQINSQKEIDKVNQKASEQRQKSALEELKFQEQLLERKIKQEGLGQADVAKLSKEKLGLSEKQLYIQAQIAAATASPQETLRISKQLEFDILDLRKQSAQELAKATGEIKAQNSLRDKPKSSDKVGGGIMNLDEMVTDNQDQWNYSKTREQKQNEKEEGPSPEAGLQKAQGQLGISNPPSLMTDAQVATLAKALQPTIKIVAPKGGSSQDARAWAWKSNET